MKLHLIAALTVVISSAPGALISANEIRLRGAVASGLNIFDDVAEESTDNLVYIADDGGFTMCGPCELALSNFNCPHLTGKNCEFTSKTGRIGPGDKCVVCPATGCPNCDVPPSSQEWDFNVVDKF